MCQLECLQGKVKVFSINDNNNDDNGTGSMTTVLNIYVPVN